MDIGFDEPHVGDQCDVVVVEFGGDEVEGSFCGDIVLFVEMGFGHDEVGVVDPLHAFLAVEFHGVFLDADGGLLQGAVHLGVQRHTVVFGAVVIHPEHFGIVVFDVVSELLVAFFEAVFTIPKHVVVAGEVMVCPSGEGVLFGGTACEQECCRQQGEEDVYVMFFEHDQFGL